MHFITTSEERPKKKLTAGLPQGSVLGLTLWYFLYDGLLRLSKPDDVEIIAYADDIAVMAKAPLTFKVGELLEKMAEVIVNWLDGIGVALALDKTELIIPMRKLTHNNLQVSVRGHSITSRASVKYLGVHLDQKATFKIHVFCIASVAERGDRGIKSLREIMPNLGGPKHHIWKLLAAVP